jgi:hypothetical protein
LGDPAGLLQLSELGAQLLERHEFRCLLVLVGAPEAGALRKLLFPEPALLLRVTALSFVLLLYEFFYPDSYPVGVFELLGDEAPHGVLNAGRPDAPLSALADLPGRR